MKKNLIILLIGVSICLDTFAQLDKDRLLSVLGEKDKWKISLDIGLGQFQGEFKNENDNIYSFSLHRELSKDISVSAVFLFGSLNGERDFPSSHDPYTLYEGNGEYFATEFQEVDIIFSKNLLSFIPLNHQKRILNNKIQLFYNLGIGINRFKSLRLNKGSNSYIYGYGYESINSNFQTPQSQEDVDLPKSTLFVYGPSMRYIPNPDLTFIISSIMRISDSPFLDAYQEQKSEKDSFRVISLGLLFNF